MKGDENAVERRLDGEFTRTEIEEWGEWAVVGELGSVTSQFIEEAVGAGLQRGQPRGRSVLQQAGAERDGLRRRSRFEHLGVGGEVTWVRCPGTGILLQQVLLPIPQTPFFWKYPGSSPDANSVMPYKFLIL